MARVTLCCLILCLAAAQAPAENFSLAFGGGYSTGGNLFRVVSPPNVPGGVIYTTPDGRSLAAAEFRTELEESFAASLRARFPLSPSFSLSLGLAFTDMDVTANRRTIADNVDQVDYDQVFFFSGDLSVEFDWLTEGNRPFVSAGLGSLRMDFEERSDGESLDQTKFGLFLGGGFRVRGLEWIHLDIEARVARAAPDFSAEGDRLDQAQSFQDEGAIWLWVLGASWVYEF